LRLGYSNYFDVSATRFGTALWRGSNRNDQWKQATFINIF
jgi:hypothetical protein